MTKSFPGKPWDFKQAKVSEAQTWNIFSRSLNPAFGSENPHSQPHVSRTLSRNEAVDFALTELCAQFERGRPSLLWDRRWSRVAYQFLYSVKHLSLN